MTEQMFGALALLSSIAGTVLLVREVRLAQDVEGLDPAIDEIKELLALYRLDRREFAIRHMEYSLGLDRDAGNAALELAGPTNLVPLTDEYFAALEGQRQASLKRWYAKTKPAVLRSRRRLLNLGFTLIVSGLVLQFAGALPVT
jgi:hypothetical protein